MSAVAMHINTWMGIVGIVKGLCDGYCEELGTKSQVPSKDPALRLTTLPA